MRNRARASSWSQHVKRVVFDVAVCSRQTALVVIKRHDDDMSHLLYLSGRYTWHTCRGLQEQSLRTPKRRPCCCSVHSLALCYCWRWVAKCSATEHLIVASVRCGQKRGAVGVQDRW